MLKLSFISISINPFVNTVSVSLSIFPLSYIESPGRPSPNTRTIFHIIQPLTFICLSIFPRICTISFRFPISINSKIYSTICKFFIPFSMFKIIIPISLINTSIGIYYYSQSWSFFLNKFSKVYCLSIIFNCECIFLF